jgi:hypothetical protein
MMRVSFAILFNLAVAFHMNACQDFGKESSLRRLKKSIMLYEKAYNMMNNRRDVSRGCTLETMAILNNIAHAHEALGNTQQARRCYEIVLSSVFAIAYRGERSSVRRFELFLNNALGYIAPDHSHTAAAA